MNNHPLITIFVCVFILLAISQLSNGFATTKCDHNNLKEQTENLSKCMEGNLDKYMNLLKIYNTVSKIFVKDTKTIDLEKACKTHKDIWKEIKTCYDTFSTTCLDPKMTALGDKVYSLFNLNCEAQETEQALDQNKLESF